MAKIGLFYGSTTGNTEQDAQLIQKEFDKHQPGLVDLFNVAGDPLTKMNDYSLLIWGCSSWGAGEMQDDWDSAWKTLKTLSFAGKKVALFGLGDSVGFSDTFQDALALLAEAARKQGAELVGMWPTDDYSFDASAAVEGDMFVGLALDDDNEAGKTPQRVAAWVQQLITEFGL